MLWPIVLPFKLTAVALLTLTLLATVVAAISGRRSGRTFLIFTFVSLIAFVPVCVMITSIMDRYRFGTFQYASFEQVDDFRVERYLPPVAREITVNKQAQGFRAKFRIGQSELDEYLDKAWAQYGDQSVAERGQLPPFDSIDPELHKLLFGDLGWPPLSDAKELHGPIAGNGAGFTVWYSPKTGIAYQSGCYW
ncbi:MAG: hypothetical protein AAGG48_25385 [Planctomycetota bacterium]